MNRVVQREDRLNLMGKAVQEKRIIMSSLNEKLDRTVLWEGGGEKHSPCCVMLTGRRE